ncbi:probable starch synthase 4, chloroplastic/amyloplastic [Gossypium raimondii]|uniref:probable starch synthase 4, chloroplastic/amyloplastic n=1 Tax=Gossypium raimondii TaxID=29730 RepID=UPI00227BB610|nr:probable starch synthase 4, chloroplastic/amyloplastic [Gossypium raimondii]
MIVHWIKKAPLYWYAPKGLNSARIYFTCHNFEYQGTASASELASCGLDAQELNRPDRMQDNTAHDSVNPVKGAIVFSNIVMTVSPTYAQEVRTAEVRIFCSFSFKIMVFLL